MVFAFLEKTIKIKYKSFSYLKKEKKDKSFKMEIAITNYVNKQSRRIYKKWRIKILSKQINIVGFITNDESKSRLKYVILFVLSLENWYKSKWT